ncbi:hypothetical protein ENH_00030150 [Eimeria necatrix]|uniref:Uncharacterized protein n=1 Tax=Eimeria necatrix TaxID=51315 RepID=U6MF44_9EIME|nr:hypothetical protein ENH_00030150 [Eimeria necatrix]CDJ62872.1 hypothetical protein ENH_00030150 [Eimeria necatrix]
MNSHSHSYQRNSTQAAPWVSCAEGFKCCRLTVVIDKVAQRSCIKKHRIREATGRFLVFYFGKSVRGRNRKGVTT